MEQKLCLEGDLAKDFLKHKVGDRITITVDAVLTQAGLRPDFENGPVETKKGANGKDREPPKKPYVEFVIAKVNGKTGKPVSDMDADEMEREIAKVKGY